MPSPPHHQLEPRILSAMITGHSFGAAVWTSSSCGKYASSARAAGGQERPSCMTAAQSKSSACCSACPAVTGFEERSGAPAGAQTIAKLTKQMSRSQPMPKSSPNACPNWMP